MGQIVKELHEKRMKLWDRTIANRKKYIDIETGVISNQYTKKRSCPVCESNNELEIFIKEGGRYVKCEDCNMVYLNPVFTNEAIKSYYESNHTEQSGVVESDTDNFYVNIYNGGLDNIQNTSSYASTILDIGCSSGTFLDLAKKRKFNTFGIELNQSEYKFAKAKGHKVYNDLLENINLKEKFDVVTLWDVFEHLEDGEFYLNEIKKVLSDSGIIFLQVPSSDSLAAKILREHCNMYDGLEHVNLYGVSTIEKLANKCGFKVLSLKTVISEIGVINNYLNYENPYLGTTTNKDFIPNLIDEEQIHETLQGYKLQVILGKE
ncbi:class I SAM-dependent methyltransferase [Sulfurimonas sp.]